MMLTDDIEVLNADCMDIMRQYPDKHFDLAVVDPPYGIDVANNTTGTVIRNKSDRDIFAIKDWDKEIPDKKYFDELMRVSKEQIICGGNYYLDILGYCKAPIIWDKLNGDSMYADGEFMWTSSGGLLPRNLKIWKHQWCGAFKDSERGIIKIHPTQKPIAFYEWVFNKHAKKALKNGTGKILDTHGGSMSSVIAADRAGLKMVCCEKDQEYFAAAVQRFTQYKSQLTIQF